VGCVSAIVDEADIAREEAELIRMEHKIGSKGRLLLAIVWATADGIANFAKYPETLGADTTWVTNVERRPLIQFVGKDGMGRSFPACQGFLPHEKGRVRPNVPARVAPGYGYPTCPMRYPTLSE
jgi:hypothetical protein